MISPLLPCPAPKGTRTTIVPVVDVTFGNEYGTVALSIYAETLVAVSLMRRGGSNRTVKDVSSLSPVASLLELRKSGVDRAPDMIAFVIQHYFFPSMSCWSFHVGSFSSPTSLPTVRTPCVGFCVAGVAGA